MIEIKPLKQLDYKEINVPGSKYIANRVLIIAALADGITTITNVPDNDDINHSIQALKHLGINIKQDHDTLEIIGCSGKLNVKGKKLDVGESGTLMRFITCVAALSNDKIHITGSQRICQRPVGELLDALGNLGVKVKSNAGCPPIDFLEGKLVGGTTNISGNVSSQYISGLLLVAPFAEKDVVINLTTELVSKKYVDLTIDLMEKFGVVVVRNEYKCFRVKAGQKYTGMKFSVPGDWSSANYFFAIAALLKGKIKVKNLNLNSKHGEARFISVLEKMGCYIEKGSDFIIVTGPEQLLGIDIDMEPMPDTVQTLTALAPFAMKKTIIRHIENLKYKECDRINDTAFELRKMGCRVETTNDAMIIYPSVLNSAVVDTHSDHRMAMSMAIIGLVQEGIKIMNPECAGKSFPGYWDKLKEIGVEIING